MKIKKLFQLGAAVTLSVSSLLVIGIPAAFAAAPYTCTWQGGGGDSLFSDAGNWVTTGSPPGNCNGDAPQAGDDDNLIFPASASDLNPVLDITGLSVGSITFTGGGYHITNAGPTSKNINISGGISDTSAGPSNEMDFNLTLTGSQTFSAGSSSELILGTNNVYNISAGTNTLTLGNVAVRGAIVGTGSLIVSDNYPTDATGVDLIDGSSSFTGSVSVNSGALFVDDPDALSAASQVTVARGALLKGDGGVSAFTVQSGGTVAPGHSPGCITATNATINGTYLAQIGGTTACTGYDQLQVSSAVNVTGASLQLSLVNGFTPSIGQSFEIIDNSGGSAVSGTFSGLAQGATFSSGGYTYQVSYKGGDGNDVTLTVVKPASAAAAALKAPDTGFGAAMGRPGVVLAVSTTAAFALVVVARRLKPMQR